MTITLSAGSISVQIADNVLIAATGTFPDGQPWVHLTSGTLQVTGWTPAATGSGATLANGAMKNPRGNWTDQGIDGRDDYNVARTFAAGGTLAAGDTLVIGKSGAGNGGTNTIFRPLYFPLPGRSRLDEAMVLSVLSYAPTDDDFRPNAIGNPASRQRVFRSSIDWGLVPSKLPVVATAPPWGQLETIFGTFGFDPMDGWQGDQWAPNFQHPGYGEYTASAVSELLCRICDQSPLATKKRATEMAIQWGIDQWGAYRDGRTHGANGGHMQGRKALIVLAGHLLRDAAMVDPTATLGANKFQEDDAYFVGGTDKWDGSRHWWSYNRGLAAANTYQDDAPSTWSVASGNTPRFFESYHGNATHGANVGTALAMGLLGRVNEWGRQAFACIQEHCAPKIAAWGAAQPVQIDYPSQVNHSWSFRGGSYCRDMWTAGFAEVYLPDWEPVVTSSTAPLLVCHAPMAFGGSIDFEIYGAPAGGTLSAARLWIGDVLATPITTNGFVQGVGATTSDALSLPNAVGYLRFSVTLSAAANEVMRELRLGLQVSFTLANGQQVATNVLATSRSFVFSTAPLA